MYKRAELDLRLTKLIFFTFAIDISKLTRCKLYYLVLCLTSGFGLQYELIKKWLTKDFIE